MNKKIKNAQSNEVDNIKFKSKLEVMIYKLLLQEGFNPQYEPQTFEIWPGFKPTIPFYDKDKKTKMLKLNDKKIISIKYTPDFLVVYNNINCWIEAKGMENDVFYIKKKLFRKYLENQPQKSLYFEIYSKKQLIQAINLIKNYENQEK